MNLALAVVCDHALIDQGGKLSVIGIFERIWVERFPAVHPRLHLVLRLKGRRTEIGDHPIVITLRDEAGREALRGEGAVHIGEPASITADTYPGKTYAGAVSFIASEAEFTPRNVQTTEERVKLVYAVKVHISGDPANELKPGMPADVRLAPVAAR